MDLLYLLQGGRGAGTSASHGLFEDEHNDHRAAKQEQQVDEVVHSRVVVKGMRVHVGQRKAANQSRHHACVGDVVQDELLGLRRLHCDRLLNIVRARAIGQELLHPVAESPSAGLAAAQPNLTAHARDAAYFGAWEFGDLHGDLRNNPRGQIHSSNLSEIAHCSALTE